MFIKTKETSIINKIELASHILEVISTVLSASITYIIVRVLMVIGVLGILLVRLLSRVLVSVLISVLVRCANSFSDLLLGWFPSGTYFIFIENLVVWMVSVLEVHVSIASASCWVASLLGELTRGFKWISTAESMTWLVKDSVVLIVVGCHLIKRLLMLLSLILILLNIWWFISSGSLILVSHCLWGFHGLMLLLVAKLPILILKQLLVRFLVLLLLLVLIHHLVLREVSLIDMLDSCGWSLIGWLYSADFIARTISWVLLVKVLLL